MKLRRNTMTSFLILVSLVLIFSSWNIPYAQIKLTDNLSLSGFLDISAETSIAEDEDTEINTSFDQFELDFHFTNNKVSTRVDVEGGLITPEQAHVSYAFSDKLSVKVGRFLSCIGFEANEPTDMYQYSLSQGIPYPSYQDGVAINFSLSSTKSRIQPAKPKKQEKKLPSGWQDFDDNDTSRSTSNNLGNFQIDIYASMVSSIWSESSNFNNPGFEAQIALVPNQKFSKSVGVLTAKIGFAGNMITDGDDSYLKSEVNTWVKLKVTESLFVAAEFDLLGNWETKGENGMHFLGMTNYRLTNKAAVTIRFSGFSIGNGDVSSEVTISPSYNFVENWRGLIEVRQTLNPDPITNIAIETIYTF